MFGENGKPFTFLRVTGSELIKMKERVNYLLQNPKEMAVKIDYDKVRVGFIKRNHGGCIDEYLLNHTLGLFLLNPDIDTPINREVFYIDAKKFLIDFKANNDIIALKKLAVA